MATNATRYLEEILGVKALNGDRPLLSGILQTRDYDQFEIRGDTGEILHTFRGAKLANRCLVGDHVYWEKDQCQLELRDEHPLLVGTIELTRPARYGFTSRKTPLYLFTPYDSRYPPMIVGTNEKDKSRNRIGLVKFETWSELSMFPRGALQMMLGISGDLEAEKKAILHQACPFAYPKISFEPRMVPPIANRKRLIGYTFHVDPQGCRDVDDVITIDTVDDGLWRIIITISDVAAFIEDGSATDIMASLISQTVYDHSGYIIHAMLPKEYSEGVCSLLPGSTRYGVSLEFLWDGHRMSESKWYESVFEVQRSYTYEEFQSEVSVYQNVTKAITSYLAKEELIDAHEWIEQLMIYYNKEAGKQLKQMGSGILRRHSDKEKERVQWFRDHLPDWKFLAMSSAEYVLSEEKDTYHSGLDTDSYAHATSPIRRYADLINQRAMKWWIHTTHEQRQRDLFIVPIAVYTLNERQRVIKQFERDMTFLTAIQSGKTKVKAIVVEKKEKIRESDGTVEYIVRLYVPEWKKTISGFYTKTGEDYIESKDGNMVFYVPIGSEHEIQCSVNWSSRNWKERLVIQWEN
jgi:exoribonuclease R